MYFEEKFFGQIGTYVYKDFIKLTTNGWIISDEPFRLNFESTWSFFMFDFIGNGFNF